MNVEINLSKIALNVVEFENIICRLKNFPNFCRCRNLEKFYCRNIEYCQKSFRIYNWSVIAISKSVQICHRRRRRRRRRRKTPTILFRYIKMQYRSDYKVIIYMLFSIRIVYFFEEYFYYKYTRIYICIEMSILFTKSDTFGNNVNFCFSDTPVLYYAFLICHIVPNVQ